MIVHVWIVKKRIVTHQNAKFMQKTMVQNLHWKVIGRFAKFAEVFAKTAILVKDSKTKEEMDVFS